jgi:hypothetical protein
MDFGDPVWIDQLIPKFTDFLIPFSKHPHEINVVFAELIDGIPQARQPDRREAISEGIELGWRHDPAFVEEDARLVFNSVILRRDHSQKDRHQIFDLQLDWLRRSQSVHHGLQVLSEAAGIVSPPSNTHDASLEPLALPHPRG